MLITTPQQAESFRALIAETAYNADLRKRIVAEPHAVLKGAGIDVPSDIVIRPLEDTDKVMHITLSTPPDEGEVSDEELAGASGGTTTVFVVSAIMMSLVISLGVVHNDQN